ncbi:MAG: c-type cytochrome [Acidobacteria bacterium]|nr:c-type cytochrome [Acidobacteriota bacterium]
MNYPVWYLPTIGGAFFIALIAITHVFVSHFAVGGGLYLIFAERLGLRRNNPAILDFTKKHAKFFILITLVFGSMTGVGIWFIIALASAGGTSLLIHNFVFGWAIEWVFFLVEIVAAFVYFYTFGKMKSGTHQAVGWVYFGAAWASLFIINGILSFMLSPGAWLESGNFWIGFFNPTFWPSLFFRTFVATMLAGVYAFLTCSFLRDGELKNTMTRFSGWWVLVSFLASIPFGYWYLTALPAPARDLVAGKSPTIQMALDYGLYAIGVVIILSLILTLIRPALNVKPVAFVVMMAAFIFLGAFEWTREAARRPFVVNQVIYSNGLTAADLEKAGADGFLASAKWTRVKEVTPENLQQAGADIFRHQCYACHTVNGWNNDIVPLTESMSYRAMVSYIKTIHEKRYFMPPFAGTDAEAEALAAYLVGGLHGKEMVMASPEGESMADQGARIFEENCSACHGYDAIAPSLAGWDADRIREALDHLSQLNEMMEDFTGTAAEKEALTQFLLTGGRVPPDGAVLFEENCSMCHGLAEIQPGMSGWDRVKIRQSLDNLSAINEMMADYDGSTSEKDALADYLAAASKAGDQ